MSDLSLRPDRSLPLSTHRILRTGAARRRRRDTAVRVHVCAAPRHISGALLSTAAATPPYAANLSALAHTRLLVTFGLSGPLEEHSLADGPLIAQLLNQL